METNFLSLSPLKRSRRIQALIREFTANAQLKKSNFIILVYGSGSYGFKKENHGTLNDIDLLLIVPRNMDVREFITSAENIFLTTLQVNTSHLEQMTLGKWDMCRMYGRASDIKLGFRIMCSDTFLSASSIKNSTVNVRNIATLGHSRIVTDIEWSFTQWKYVPVTLPHEYMEESREQLLLVNHRTFSKNKNQLGAYGRKLLMSSIVYDPYEYVEAALLCIFKQMVEASLRSKNTRSNDEIIKCLYRVERFSDQFKKRILGKISLARALL